MTDHFESSRFPCCSDSIFPYRPDVFRRCLPEFVELQRTGIMQPFPAEAGPRFARGEPIPLVESADGVFQSETTPHLRAMTLVFPSTQRWTANREEMRHFVELVDVWFENELSSAPEELRGGWLLVSGLVLYDQQTAMLYGTATALCIAMLIAFVVIVLTTMNLLISAVALIGVALVLLLTGVALALLGNYFGV